MSLFNINNVICLNLQKLSISEISIISSEFDLCFDTLTVLKNKGYIKIWVEKSGEWVIAVVNKNNHFVICDNYLSISKKEKKMILALKPIKALKSTKKNDIIDSFDLDSILDKINEHGLQSLTDKEFKFLKSF